MKRFEMIREIMNSCDNSRMRDVDFREIETDDLDSIVSEYAVGRDVRCERFDSGNGVTVFEIDIFGLNQRITFTEIP